MTSKRKLSNTVKWAILAAVAAMHPLFLYVLFPSFGEEGRSMKAELDRLRHSRPPEDYTSTTARTKTGAFDTRH